MLTIELLILQCGAKNSFLFEFPALLQTTNLARAADAQPISSDGTFVTVLSKVFFCLTLYFLFIKKCEMTAKPGKGF